MSSPSRSQSEATLSLGRAGRAFELLAKLNQRVVISLYYEVDKMHIIPWAEQDENEERDSNDIQEDTLPPPDGGFVAWLQVFGCFWIWFNTWYRF